MRRVHWLLPFFYILFVLAPIYWLLNMSFKTTNEILGSFTLWPHQFTFDNYRKIFTDATWYNGYLNSMPDERFLIAQLHELLMYLGQKGVATILVAAHQGMISSQMSAPVDASYLADAVVLIRYFEADGEVRQALSVVKMRGGEHERTIREFWMADGRIHVGEPLRAFRGVLSGVPEKLAGIE